MALPLLFSAVLGSLIKSKLSDFSQAQQNQFGLDMAKTGINNAMSMANSAYNNQLDLQSFYQKSSYQNQMNIANWNMQNAYNTPSAQVARLKQAGLAPELMYSNGANTGIASDIPAVSAPGLRSPAQMFGLPDRDLSTINLNNAKANTESTIQRLNSARTTLTSEQANLVCQQYMSEVERTAYYRLVGLTAQFEYDALSKTYDVDIVDKDGNKTTKSIKGSEIPYFTDATYLTIALLDKTEGVETFAQILRSIQNACDAEYQEYVAQYGSDGLSKLETEIARGTLKTMLQEYGVDDFDFDSRGDFKTKTDNKKLQGYVWEIYNNLRFIQDQITHTNTGSTSEKWNPLISSGISGAATLAGAWLFKSGMSRKALSAPPRRYSRIRGGYMKVASTLDMD